MKPRFFPTPAAFRAWLQKHHQTAGELLVGFYKRDCGKPSITWPESVDEALCFGWIDGVRRNYAPDAYTIRFTPRRPTSIWSAINIAKVAALTTQKRMQPAGLAAFAKRSEAKSRIYSYEQKDDAVFEPAHEKQFKARKQAWAFFQAQPPGYRRQMTRRVTNARQPETRQRRLDKLIAACERGRRLV
jgi:uncharacterized protein YdeI (YjbR/CyaY-like superfamily)